MSKCTEKFHHLGQAQSLYISLHYFCAGEIWAGWDDEREEGTFQNTDTGAPLSNKLDLWYAGEPNGGRMENCAIVWVPRKAWNDLRCDDFCHGFCRIEARPRTKIRGAIISNHYNYSPFANDSLISVVRTPS